MSRELPNELEERRVIRLLAGAAEAVPPLHEAEIERVVRLAAAPARSHLSRRRAILRQRWSLLGAAAAAAVLAVLLPIRQHEPDHHSTSPSSSSTARLVSFPEGSALSLLLSRPSEKRA